MPRRTFRIPTLTGGVSQQPPATRLPTQCQESINAIASIAEGLKKRGPTEHLARLSAAPTGSTIKHHTVDLSSTERYHVAIQDQFLRIWDIQDTADPSTDLTVLDNTGLNADTSDFAYLSSSNPAEDLQLLTVSDYTLILNKSVTPALKATKVAKANPLAVVYPR